MQQVIIDRIETTREQISAWRSDQLDELQERHKALVKQGETALHNGKGSLRNLEANTLESARDLLSWAGDTLGPRASFLKRGKDALDDALVALRSGHSATLPVADFDQLSIKKVLPFLNDLNGAELRTLKAYETRNKARKTLLSELTHLIEAASVATAEL
jgi:hypothetical protein